MKKQLAELVREAKEKHIYSDEIAQYLIERGVVIQKHGEWEMAVMKEKHTNREHLAKLDNRALVEWILFDAPNVGRMSTLSVAFLSEWLDREYDGWINLREYGDVMRPRMEDCPKQ